MESARQSLQAAEYDFPYHHVPHAIEGRPRLGRTMRSAMEYMAYTNEVLAVVGELEPLSVLDVGCGDGRLLADLQGTANRLVGIDLDRRAVGFARAFAPDAETAVKPVESVKETFDVVTCIETLEHVSDAAVSGFLRATASCVRPGGHLVITVPTTAVPVHRKHFRHYDTVTLQQSFEVLGSDWKILRLKEIVPHCTWIDNVLRVMSNRWWALDLPPLNQLVLRRLLAPVSAEERGLHLLAVLQKAG